MKLAKLRKRIDQLIAADNSGGKDPLVRLSELVLPLSPR